jgi:putative transposase
VRKGYRKIGRKQKHPIALSQQEREELERIVKGGENRVRVVHRAQMVLWSDAGKSDLEIAELLSINPLTVANTRQRWVEQHSLVDQARPGRPPILDGKQEAFLVALTCSDSPEGREGWTMQLLADRLVQLQIVQQPISDETVRRTLKKTISNLG